jgi:hypothetical protein
MAEDKAADTGNQNYLKTRVNQGTAVYRTVRTVVWEDGGNYPASYPIDAALRQKDRKAASFYAGREYN